MPDICTSLLEKIKLNLQSAVHGPLSERQSLLLWQSVGRSYMEGQDNLDATRNRGEKIASVAYQLRYPPILDRIQESLTPAFARPHLTRLLSPQIRGVASKIKGSFSSLGRINRACSSILPQQAPSALFLATTIIMASQAADEKPLLSGLVETSVSVTTALIDLGILPALGLCGAYVASYPEPQKPVYSASDLSQVFQTVAIGLEPYAQKDIDAPVETYKAFVLGMLIARLSQEKLGLASLENPEAHPLSTSISTLMPVVAGVISQKVLAPRAKKQLTLASRLFYTLAVDMKVVLEAPQRAKVFSSLVAQRVFDAIEESRARRVRVGEEKPLEEDAGFTERFWNHVKSAARASYENGINHMAEQGYEETKKIKDSFDETFTYDFDKQVQAFTVSVGRAMANLSFSFALSSLLIDGTCGKQGLVPYALVSVLDNLEGEHAGVYSSTYLSGKTLVETIGLAHRVFQLYQLYVFSKPIMKELEATQRNRPFLPNQNILVDLKGSFGKCATDSIERSLEELGAPELIEFVKGKLDLRAVSKDFDHAFSRNYYLLFGEQNCVTDCLALPNSF